MQDTLDETIIPYSRKKLALVVVFMIFCLSISIWDIQSNECGTYYQYRWLFLFIENNSPLHYTMSIFAIMACTSIAFISIYKILASQPALVLNADGLIDNSSASAVGFIPWADIQSFEVYHFGFNRMLLVKVRNASKYTSKGNILKQFWLKLGQLTGTPISLSAGMLPIQFKALVALCNQYHARYGQPNPS